MIQIKKQKKDRQKSYKIYSNIKKDKNLQIYLNQMAEKFDKSLYKNYFNKGAWKFTEVFIKLLQTKNMKIFAKVPIKFIWIKLQNHFL